MTNPPPIDLREILWLKRQWMLTFSLMRRANSAGVDVLPRSEAARKALDEYFDRLEKIVLWD